MAEENPLKVRFAGMDTELHFGQYKDGSVALILNTRDGEGVACATACVPGTRAPEGHALLKDYSENAGMLQALTEAGIVRDTGAKVSSGFAQLHVVELLVQPPWKAHEAAQLEATVQELEKGFLAEKQAMPQQSLADMRKAAKEMEHAQGRQPEQTQNRPRGRGR